MAPARARPEVLSSGVRGTGHTAAIVAAAARTRSRRDTLFARLARAAGPSVAAGAGTTAGAHALAGRLPGPVGRNINRGQRMDQPSPAGLRRYLVAPLLLLLLALLALRALGALGLRPLATWRGAARHALALMYAFTASAHFTRRRADLVRMMPPWVPVPGAAVAVTGALELLGAAGLLAPATAPLAGRGLAALLVALFPANVHAARRGITLGGKPPTPLGFRTLVQALFIALTLWASHRPPPDQHTPERDASNRPWWSFPARPGRSS